MSLMIMKGSITPAIRGAIPDSDNAMSYIESVEEQFLGTSKSLASTLMIKMITMKYDGHSGVREHIMKMSDMASQLKGMDMAILEGFLVHFIMTALPSQFGHFKINYNTQKDKWKMSELIAMCVQEEKKLKVEKPDVAHLTIGLNKKSFKKGKGKKKKQALKTVVHILNLVPSKVVPKTPYELWVEVSRNENENVPTTEVSLRRSQREKRPAISNDYKVYLNECDYDVGLENDSTSYDQAINSENSTLWLYAMEEELKSMKDNEV
ncbi:hypothetical protein CK203_055223 [Vitis vinifera]|uniref:Retrovirus-related Pol polyprotein from transposon TNT 1-94 n=1 Tax=Vitis vinifera TaxID=29760 RepID=A0A438GU03_VITVI|nr:hypothetical protein CK203_055223 [Vitis vinifera]